jgi:hypothetical protein
MNSGGSPAEKRQMIQQTLQQLGIDFETLAEAGVQV